MTLAGLVDDIYEAAFLPEQWNGVLDRAGRITGSASGSLLLTEGLAIDRWRTTELTFDPLARFTADEGWRHGSPRAQVLARGLQKQAGWICANDLLTPAQLLQDPIERALARVGLGWQTGAAIALPNRKLAVFTFERHAGDGRHRAAGVAALEQLRPHLLRAAMLASRLGDERARGALAALAALDVPRALLDAQGRLREANALLTPALLDLRAGSRVVLGEPHVDAWLPARLAGALPRAGCVALPAQGTRPARLAHLVPVADEARSSFSSATLLLFFSTVRRSGGSAPDAPTLRVLFDLSPAESRPGSALAGGLDLTQAALASGIQLSTARSCLERIFDKTGCHRQTELVRLLAGIGSTRAPGADGSAMADALRRRAIVCPPKPVLGQTRGRRPRSGRHASVAGCCCRPSGHRDRPTCSCAFERLQPLPPFAPFMNDLRLFLPCAAGVEDFLAQEVHGLTGLAGDDLLVARGGVRLRAGWRDVLGLNLHGRLAQRVLVEVVQAPYRHEGDLYDAAGRVAWEAWFTPKHTFKVELTAQHSPLKSLNFAALKIKDAVVDRFRAKAGGVRPSVETQWPDVRVFAHLTHEVCTLYIDTSGEPLFKRGWRHDKGDAPLKETLAAALLAASGWWDPEARSVSELPLYDPCCGSGTIPIEAAQLALGIPAGALRRFGFEKLLPHQPHIWDAMKNEADNADATSAPGRKVLKDAELPAIYGSDVAHRMVDFAERNAQRAGVADAVQLRGGDALQRMPPPGGPGLLLLNPPYGERIETAGVAGTQARRGRERPQSLPADPGASAAVDDGSEFFSQLSSHWKKHYAGWQAWVLTPDLKLPGRMRLKESRRVPLWNGPIECRLFRFDLVAGSARRRPADAAIEPLPDASRESASLQDHPP